MATTIRQTEAIPAAYPAVPDGMSPAAAALGTTIWQRIEAYIAYRWSEREVVWTVEGPGGWVPPLAPATITSVEVWSGIEEWQEVVLSPSPLGGYCLPGCGPYRFSGTVGAGDVPAAVSEAFKRLAEYMAAKPGKPGARSESISAGSISISHSRSPSFMAAAMENSGAGDLLRSYRRAA